VTEDDVEVFVSDVRTGTPQIEDESVNVVLVDPPYDGKTVSELYRHISTVAGRILREGGSLAVMCGGAYLDKAMWSCLRIKGYVITGRLLTYVKATAHL
jgi:16S rRNA G966 N2-methylase RsmD